MNQAHGPQLCHCPQGTWGWRWSDATRGLWGSRTSCIAHPNQGVTDPEPNHYFWQGWQGVNDFRPALRRGPQVDGKQLAARPVQPGRSRQAAMARPMAPLPQASPQQVTPAGTVVGYEGRDPGVCVHRSLILKVLKCFSETISAPR